MQNIHHILKQYWGFSSFRPLQEEIIQSVLEGRDTLALLPTGGGKSICFQVPALARQGLCLVVSPLIALMRDQVFSLNQKGIKAVAIYTGLSRERIDAILDSCVYSDFKFLYISPERLSNEDFQMRVERMNISLIAVDEAHCISQWGYDFRPSYLKIAELRDKLKGVPVIALTATATPEVVLDMQEKLKFPAKSTFQKSFVRKNLSYVVRQAQDKYQSLIDILTKVNGSAIIYARSRKRTKEYSDFLNKKGLIADYYHAGLQPNERALKQDSWMRNKTRIICATNAFGMGIDKPDVRLVIHMDLAESLEAYFQEAGRAGRDENKAYATQLFDPSDIFELDKKLKDIYPNIDFIRDVYECLGQYFKLPYNEGEGSNFDFDLRQFCDINKLNITKALLALKILEQQAVIINSDSIYNSSQVKAVTSKEVLFKFQEQNPKYEPLIKLILRTSEGVFEDYVSIEEETIASRLKLSINETIELLNGLQKFQIFSYQPRTDKPKIIFLQNRVKKNELRLDLGFIQKRKQNYEDKLKAVRNYVTEGNVCRTRLLVKYFGEALDEDCGICDVCSTRKKGGLKPKDFSEIVLSVERELKSNPLAILQLKAKLNIDDVDFNKAIEFLLESGKVTKNRAISFEMGRVKRLVFTVTNDLTYDQRMQKICRSLAKAGYEIELVGRERSFSIPLKPEPFHQTRLKCIFNKGKLFYIEYNLRLLFYLVFTSFDATCAIDLDTVIPVFLIGKLTGSKLVYDAHEYFTEVPEVIRRPAVQKFWQWVEKTFVPRFDLIYTVSPGLAEIFEGKFKKPVEVILNVPLSKAKSGDKANAAKQAFLLYQGALNEGRGLEPLLACTAELDCGLKIAGEGDLSNELRQLTIEKKLESKVQFLGLLEPPELSKLTEQAYIGINLLENKGLSYYYSLSNKFFDYMQAGVPQLCIDFPEYHRLNEQYHVAVLIKDCSIGEIKQGIERLLADKALYSQLQKNCEVCSLVLNWGEEEKKLLGLYERLFR